MVASVSFWPKSCRTTFNDKGENVGTGARSRLLVIRLAELLQDWPGNANTTT
jgi:hypothetical protein